MKKIIFAILLAPIVLVAAPLDQPVATAVESLSTSDPKIKALWEAVALADIKVAEAKSTRDAAMKAADSKISAFVKTDAGATIAGLRKELSSANQRRNAARSWLADYQRQHRSILSGLGVRNSELLAARLNGTKTSEQFETEAAGIRSEQVAADQKLREAFENLTASQTSVEQVIAAIVAQEKRLADARQAVRGDLDKFDVELACREAAKNEALEAFREAAQSTLVARHPESTDTTRAFFGK